ncbi:hypothetical protein K438DRAFT_1965516 [Mycena galopus ATCC 62051]|nr:hypothetical protein K438DRAFT_1965516 [Mycena galopus ATCC 62051]
MSDSAQEPLNRAETLDFPIHSTASERCWRSAGCHRTAPKLKSWATAKRWATKRSSTSLESGSSEYSSSTTPKNSPPHLFRTPLKAPERVNAASERTHHHGTVPNTHPILHYTVTAFVDGAPLTNERCHKPEVRQQIVDLYRALRQIRPVLKIPVSTVEEYKSARGLSDFAAFLSHCDLAPENIIGQQSEPLAIEEGCDSVMSISVID